MKINSLVVNCGYKAAARRVKFVLLFSVLGQAAAEIVDLDNLKCNIMKQIFQIILCIISATVYIIFIIIITTTRAVW